MFYLEYNLELSAESNFDYYVLHYKYKKVLEDSHVYNEKNGYVMLKYVDGKYKLLSLPKKDSDTVLEYVAKLNKEG